MSESPDIWAAYVRVDGEPEVRIFLIFKEVNGNYIFDDLEPAGS
jgi:hypothetical protein